MAQIFMSFIHEEQGIAGLIRAFMHEVLGDGIESFMSSDESAIYAGENWMERIFEELKQATVLVSILTPDSVGRPWINFEAGAAWMRDTKVIPVCFKLDVANLPKPYSSLQAIDIRTMEGCYYLVSSVAHYLKRPLPERPIFNPLHTGPLAMTDTDRERNKKLLIPYKSLMLFLGHV